MTLQLDHHPAVVALRYDDDGPGIPAGDRDPIFTPLFTSRRQQGGTGLGLPIARSLLAAGRGAIDLSVSGRGVAFPLTFHRG